MSERRDNPSFNIFHDLTIRTKTYLASGILLMCLIAVAVVVYTTSRTVTNNLHQLSQVNLPTRAAAAAVNNAVIAAHMKVFRYVSWASNGVNDNLLRDLREAIDKDIQTAHAAFENLSKRPDLTATTAVNLDLLQAKLKEYEDDCGSPRCRLNRRADGDDDARPDRRRLHQYRSRHPQNPDRKLRTVEPHCGNAG